MVKDLSPFHVVGSSHYCLVASRAIWECLDLNGPGPWAHRQTLFFIHIKKKEKKKRVGVITYRKSCADLLVSTEQGVQCMVALVSLRALSFVHTNNTHETQRNWILDSSLHQNPVTVLVLSAAIPLFISPFTLCYKAVQLKFRDGPLGWILIVSTSYSRGCFRFLICIFSFCPNS